MDVWGPFCVTPMDGYKYYVSLIDHFTHYIWYFAMKHNSDASFIFTSFKVMVKKHL